MAGTKVGENQRRAGAHATSLLENEALGNSEAAQKHSIPVGIAGAGSFPPELEPVQLVVRGFACYLVPWGGYAVYTDERRSGRGPFTSWKLKSISL